MNMKPNSLKNFILYSHFSYGKKDSKESDKKISEMAEYVRCREAFK